MVKVKVVVGKKEIEKGTPFDCRNCPIALALQKTFKGAAETKASVHLSLLVGEKPFTYRVPKSCNDFMDVFDGFMKGSPKPFNFVLTLSNRAAKLLSPSKKYIIGEK